MSYQVLARKWRPRTFSELAGQEHVQRALINALDSERLHHAFLFTGTRGVGKTTIARILAKSLNCEKGVSANPCGECNACTEINEGRFVDLIEVDAASKTKVEDTRELLENVQYAPTRGRYKVYLIDEVHMLSTHSFNALLKTLEEPPPHVKFLLATTDPQKLPVTILSRCIQFNLKRLPAELIREYLEKILKAENIAAETAAVALIADAADGSMRDGLSLLDQAIAFGGGDLKEDDVRAMLGSVDKKHVYDLLQAVAARDSQGLLSVIEQLASHTADFTNVLNELLSVLHRVALAQLAPDAIDDQAPEKAFITQLAQTLSPEDTQLFYQIGLISKRDLSLAPNPRLGFEMTMLRMLTFHPDNVEAPRPVTSSESSNLKSTPVKTTPTSASTTTPSPAAATSAPATTSSVDTKTHHLDAISKTLGAASTKKKLNRADKPAQPAQTAQPATAETKTTATTPSVTEPATQPASNGPLPLPTDNSDWESLVERLPINGVPLQLARNCAFSHCKNSQLELTLFEGHQQFFSKQRQEILEKAIGEATGEDIKLSITISANATETPASRKQQRNAARQQSAEQSIYDDTIVKSIIETFEGKIPPKSIQPID
ncbi:MAG: DNA polymerase III subunit gamma/tau [Gammaproteobacteria bacterium]|jgi:DNA polymerase-3 subunit gamma/tau